MEKNFNGWNEIKKRIHTNKERRFYHEREIWWCTIGVNIGFEQDGKNTGFQRPVLILKGLSRETCLIAPLTTSGQVNKNRIKIGTLADKSCSVILSQLKTVDTKRLTNRIAVLEKSTFGLIRKSIKNLF